MRRATPALVALLLVASTLAAVPAATMAQETTSTETDTSVAPGAQLAGVVGVQGAELEGDIATRAFGIQVAQAGTDDAKARVVGDTLADVRDRVDRLEQRREALAEARENGSMSEGEYRARVAQLHAEAQTTDRLTAQANDTASRLPAETLRANGVNVTAIRTLSERSDELTGPETAEIARQIAGPTTQGGLPGPAEDRARGDAERPTDGTDAPGTDRPTNGTDAPGADRPAADDPETTATTETSANETADDGERRGADGTDGN